MTDEIRYAETDDEEASAEADLARYEEEHILETKEEEELRLKILRQNKDNAAKARIPFAEKLVKEQGK